MRPMRILAALVALLVVSSLSATPVGAYVETLNTGNTGDYTVNDFNGQPGVTCKFEDNANDAKDEIDRIKVRQHWSHGPFAQDSWVGFRFVVKANTPPLSDGTFRRVYRSPIQKKKANQTEIATFSGSWRAPEGSKAQHRVQVQFIYYAKGSTSKVVGKTRGIIEVYEHRLNPVDAYPLGEEGAGAHCRRNYHGV